MCTVAQYVCLCVLNSWALGRIWDISACMSVCIDVCVIVYIWACFVCQCGSGYIFVCYCVWMWRVSNMCVWVCICVSLLCSLVCMYLWMCRCLSVFMCVFMCLDCLLVISEVHCCVFLLVQKCLGVLIWVYLAVVLYGMESLGFSPAFGSSMRGSNLPLGHLWGGSHLLWGHLWAVAGLLGAHPLWSRFSLLSVGCGSQSGGHHPLQGRRWNSEVMVLEVMGGKERAGKRRGM